MLLRYPHQLHMKNIIKQYKDISGYFNQSHYREVLQCEEWGFRPDFGRMANLPAFITLKSFDI